MMSSSSWDGVVPANLLESEDYKALSPKQQDGFLAKLHYCDEVAEKAACAAVASDFDLQETIDDIELDALSILSLGDAQTQVSSYKVHSSWTFNCEEQAMMQYVVHDAAKFLSTQVSFMISDKHAKEWLLQWAHVLRLSLLGFSKSSSFTESITHLIVIDALLSSYLTFACVARLNGVIGQ